MKNKKVISFLIILLTSIWIFQYFLGYIKDLRTISVMFIGPSVWVILIAIGVFQMLKLAIEKEKHLERATYVLLIFSLVILTFYNPAGPINWEKYEAENYLMATMRGGTLKLKPNNKFKFTSNGDFYFGTYHIENDTLFLNSKKATPYMDKDSYAMLQKTKVEPISYSTLCLYQNFDTRKGLCIPLVVKTVKMEILEQ